VIRTPLKCSSRVSSGSSVPRRSRPSGGSDIASGRNRERAVARALTTAGDLAHGLKTPLAVLAQEAEQADAAGHHDLAATLRQLVERMQRQVDYHLARARATASVRAAVGLRCSVLPSVEGLVRTMRRLHAGRELRIDADVSPAHEIRGRREDLDEMLGNLLDNACKWARSRVAISSAIDHAQLLISVDDDGPGLDPSMRAQVLQRGVRADQQVRGSGLGLAIVSDLRRALRWFCHAGDLAARRDARPAPASTALTNETTGTLPQRPSSAVPLRAVPVPSI
jgi:signal transduction histidine kinase